jgi:hypothetical protein
MRNFLPPPLVFSKRRLGTAIRHGSLALVLMQVSDCKIAQLAHIGIGTAGQELPCRQNYELLKRLQFFLSAGSQRDFPSKPGWSASPPGKKIFLNLTSSQLLAL